MDDDIDMLLPEDLTFDQTEDGGICDNEAQITNSGKTGYTEDEMNLRVLAPELPASKKFHLFICYASEDRNRILPIVTELETVFGTRCLFADRDFQPGKEIRLNIEEGINNSVKILTILSPNFTRSRYCMHESEIAFQKSMETGLNYVIPVLLEECEIPYGLKPKTYIDATLLDMSATTIARRVTMALNQPESLDALLSYDMISTDNKYKNGFSFDIEAKLRKDWWCRLSVYKFYTDDQIPSMLKAAHIKCSSPSQPHLNPTFLSQDMITPRQLHQAMSVLNQHPVLEYQDLQSFQKVCCIGLCCYPAIAAILTALVFLIGLLVTSHSNCSADAFAADVAISCTLPIAVIIAFMFCGCLCCCGKRKMKQVKMNRIYRRSPMQAPSRHKA